MGAARELAVASLAVVATAASACPTEDELLAIGRASLADSPALEAHLADCATCSALLASVLAAPAPWDALAGTTLGPYRLDAQIGAGGMGAVYRATDTRLGRAIAVKVLHGEQGKEARAAAAIDHPAIVGIHDVGTANGVTYVAMELVEGESLRSAIGKRLDATALAIELADALAAAHACGVIHRDLKPENLIVAKDGRLRVLDFGLAKIAGAEPLDVTVPGTVQGTAGYMAPEQARGEPTDARTDIFALGAIVHEVASGMRAFPGATHADRLSAVLRDTPPRLEGPLGAIVARCLAKDPAQRFQSAADLAWTLRREAPVVARPSRRALILGAGAATAAALGGFLVGRRRASAPATRVVTFEPITYKTGRVYSARFTPDGHRLAFGAAWDADPVRGFIADLATRTTSPLGIDGDVSAISSRGELATCLGRRFTEHQSATGQLATRPLAGGTPRVLAERVQEADFANDALAIVRRTGAGFAVELPIGTPIIESAGWITDPRVSPDGTRIAFVEHPHVNDDAGELVVVDLASKQRRVLARGWQSIAGIAWAGDELWFTAARDSALNVVHAARMDGTLRTIAQTTGRLRLHDVTTDRRAAVTVDAWRLRTRIGERDISLSEVSFVTDISADGATLAVAELGNAETANGAYLVPIAGGNPIRLGPGFPLAISSSGQRVVANVEDKLVVYATASGDTPTFRTPGHVMGARWLDEQTLVGFANGKLWRLALGAAPVELGPGARRFVLDAARARAAFVDRAGALHVVTLATGADRVIAQLPQCFVCGWLASGAIVTCTLMSPLDLVRVDAETGARSPHAQLAPPALGLKGVDAVVVHPDGERIAYSYGQELSQLFVMTT
jgi:hypothetical protein